ncbi:hypothetical protein Dimus_032137, partial [Dionaea muscipula]
HSGSLSLFPLPSSPGNKRISTTGENKASQGATKWRTAAVTGLGSALGRAWREGSTAPMTYFDAFDDAIERSLLRSVCCDGCDVWVHAECAKILNKHLKDLEEGEYYCPDCKPKFEHQLLYSGSAPKVNGNWIPLNPPDKIIVVCNGMEATYFPSLHLVECNCGSCGTRKQRLCEWERHTGCRSKKWKYSVKVKGSMITLEKWVHSQGFDSG